MSTRRQGDSVPFKSKKQEAFLWANRPDIARRWTKKSSNKRKTASLEKLARTAFVKRIQRVAAEMGATPLQIATGQVKIPLLEKAIERGYVTPGFRRQLFPVAEGSTSTVGVVRAPKATALAEGVTKSPRLVVRKTPKVVQRAAPSGSDAALVRSPSQVPTKRVSRSKRERQVQQGVSAHKRVQTAYESDPLLRELADMPKLIASQPKARWALTGPRGKQKKLLAPGSYFTAGDISTLTGISPGLAAKATAFTTRLQRKHGILHGDVHPGNVGYLSSIGIKRKKPYMLDFDYAVPKGINVGKGGGHPTKVPKKGFQTGKDELDKTIEYLTSLPMVGKVNPQTLQSIYNAVQTLFTSAHKKGRLNQSQLESLIRDIAAGKVRVSSSGSILTGKQLKKATAATALPRRRKPAVQPLATTAEAKKRTI